MFTIVTICPTSAYVWGFFQELMEVLIEIFRILYQWSNIVALKYSDKFSKKHKIKFAMALFSKCDRQI